MMSKKRCYPSVLALLMMGVSAAVSAATPEATTTSMVVTAEPSTTRRAESPHFRVEQWALDDTEWQRYQTLLQGIRGSVSPVTLSPIEVLGIHARTDEERQRYAERWAVMMREDAERILAFQRAYDEASRRLFPSSVLIDPQHLSHARPVIDAASQFTWQASDRVLFFADTQCPACDAVLERLVSQLDHFSGIDLYLTDVANGEEERIRDWAASQRIDPHWVSQHKITLNIDAGALDQVTAHTGLSHHPMPTLILRRDDRLRPLPVSRF